MRATLLIFVCGDPLAVHGKLAPSVELERTRWAVAEQPDLRLRGEKVYFAPHRMKRKYDQYASMDMAAAGLAEVRL